jgi:L-iditol 2-dehydrogenase
VKKEEFMRTAVYYKNSDIRIEERSVPKIDDGEVLVRVEASGICGSDVMEWYRIHKAPLVLGHEVAGEIVELGKDVQKYKKGDRVVIAHHVPCDACDYCMDGHPTVCDTLRKTNIDPGGFCEFTRVPAIQTEKGLFKMPEEVSYEEASFAEPIACVLRALKITKLIPGQSVLVLGSGIAGILAIHLARVMGAGFIMATDISKYRLDAAKKFGADIVVNAAEDIKTIFKENNRGRLADIVFVSAGAEKAQYQALECIDRGGTVMFFAPTGPGVKIPISINELFFRNDITLTTSYAGAPSDYRDALELISRKRVNVKDMITHRFGLSDIQKGFELVVKAEDSIKVIIEPQR